MAGPRWTLFLASAGVVMVAVVVLTRATAGLVADDGAASMDDLLEGGATALLLNLGVTHGIVGVSLLALAWYARIPPAALGIGAVEPARDLLIGAGLGVGLAVVNEGLARVFDRAGVAVDDRLRRWLAPETGGGWVLLLGVVLPIVAAGEELLFRAALIGVPAAGYGFHPAVLILGAAIPFGLAHGIQGRAGMVVAGGLGVALGWAFVATGSLLVVFVAHLVVNGAEFVSHEALSGR